MTHIEDLSAEYQNALLANKVSEEKELTVAILKELWKYTSNVYDYFKVAHILMFDKDGNCRLQERQWEMALYCLLNFIFRYKETKEESHPTIYATALALAIILIHEHFEAFKNEWVAPLFDEKEVENGSMATKLLKVCYHEYRNIYTTSVICGNNHEHDQIILSQFHVVLCKDIEDRLSTATNAHELLKSLDIDAKGCKQDAKKVFGVIKTLLVHFEETFNNTDTL